MSEETKKTSEEQEAEKEIPVTDGDQEEENLTPEGEDLPKKTILQAKKLPQRIKKKKNQKLPSSERRKKINLSRRWRNLPIA